MAYFYKDSQTKPVKLSLIRREGMANMLSKPIKDNQTMCRNHGLLVTVWMLKSVTRSHKVFQF